VECGFVEEMVLVAVGGGVSGTVGNVGAFVWIGGAVMWS